MSMTKDERAKWLRKKIKDTFAKRHSILANKTDEKIPNLMVLTTAQTIYTLWLQSLEDDSKDI